MELLGGRGILCRRNFPRRNFLGEIVQEEKRCIFGQYLKKYQKLNKKTTNFSTILFYSNFPNPKINLSKNLSEILKSNIRSNYIGILFNQIIAQH